MSIDTLDFCIDIGTIEKKYLLKFPFRKKHGKIVLESCENNFAFRQISTRRPSSSGAEVKTKFPRAGKSSPRRRSRNGRQRATRDGEPLWKMKAYLEPTSRRNTFPFDGSTIFFQRKQRPLIASFLHIETKKSVDLTKGTAFESIFEKFPTTRENPIGIGRWELRKGRHAEEDGGCKGKENWKGRRRKESEG